MSEKQQLLGSLGSSGEPEGSAVEGRSSPPPYHSGPPPSAPILHAQAPHPQGALAQAQAQAQAPPRYQFYQPPPSAPFGYVQASPYVQAAPAPYQNYPTAAAAATTAAAASPHAHYQQLVSPGHGAGVGDRKYRAGVGDRKCTVQALGTVSARCRRSGLRLSV